MRPQQEIDRFFVKTVEQDRGYSTPCLVWRGRIEKRYGVFELSRLGGPQRTVKAHRYAYALVHGEGYLHSSIHGRTHELDHLCRQTDCVRADHLEWATTKLNRQRAWDVNRGEVCAQGHLRSEWGHIMPSGRVVCRKCRMGIDAKRYAERGHRGVRRR